jgi:hypothetical protein
MTWMRLLRDHSGLLDVHGDLGLAAPVPARLGQGGGRQGQHGQEGDRGHELSQTVSPSSLNP